MVVYESVRVSAAPPSPPSPPSPLFRAPPTPPVPASPIITPIASVEASTPADSIARLQHNFSPECLALKIFLRLAAHGKKWRESILIISLGILEDTQSSGRGVKHRTEKPGLCNIFGLKKLNPDRFKAQFSPPAATAPRVRLLHIADSPQPFRFQSEYGYASSH
ncbi:hypothetical protein D3C85_487350 [compost metagenome]